MTFENLRSSNKERCTTMFHPINEWSITDWACAMGGEAGEVLNKIKKLRRLHKNNPTQKELAKVKNIDMLLEGIGEEIADTVIYADLLCQRLGLDMETLVSNKFNKDSKEMNCYDRFRL